MSKQKILLTAGVLLLCLVLAVSLTACGAGQDVDSYPENSDYVEGELTGESLAKIVAKNLGVPDKPGISWEIGSRYFWDSGQVYFREVSFFENGEEVAGAFVDPRNGELLRNIMLYTPVE